MRISIVTPSLNQGRFLDCCMRSVLEQDVPDLEYVVVDGGSTDGSGDIIRRHANRLTHWVSEPDEGHYAAVNKGLARTTGEIMGWLNSDDMYTPWALSVVLEVFQRFPDVDWITSLFPLRLDERGRAVACREAKVFARQAFLLGQNLLPRSSDFGWTRTGIQQESTFWRRRLWERAGGRLETRYTYAADFDLWARFWEQADLIGVSTPLGAYRTHPGQRTRNAMDRYWDEAVRSFNSHAGRRAGLGRRWVHRLCHIVPSRLLPALPWAFRGRVIVQPRESGAWEIEERYFL